MYFTRNYYGIFHDNFWQNIKSFSKEKSSLTIHTKLDRNSQKLTVWDGGPAQWSDDGQPHWSDGGPMGWKNDQCGHRLRTDGVSGDGGGDVVHTLSFEF